MRRRERFPGNALLGGPSRWDRADALRHEEGVLDRLRADPATRVVVVRGGRALIDRERLVTIPADAVTDPARWALLGLLPADGGADEGEDGAALLLAAIDEESAESVEAGEWAGPREAAGRLEPADAEMLISAVALAAWFRDAPFCAACGGATEFRSAGWSRRCPDCGREHFPRTDPAVIVAVQSPDGERLLLGANAQWRGEMFSCFAGFVEAGESLEQTIHREVAEEAGVQLSAVRYVASQPWPYPRSMMLGFRAVAAEERTARPDGEEIIDVRWFTRAEIGEALAGRGAVRMPGAASIANALIREWYEERGDRLAADTLPTRAPAFGDGSATGPGADRPASASASTSTSTSANGGHRAGGTGSGA